MEPKRIHFRTKYRPRADRVVYQLVLLMLDINITQHLLHKIRITDLTSEYHQHNHLRIMVLMLVYLVLIPQILEHTQTYLVHILIQTTEATQICH